MSETLCRCVWERVVEESLLMDKSVVDMRGECHYYRVDTRKTTEIQESYLVDDEESLRRESHRTRCEELDDMKRVVRDEKGWAWEIRKKFNINK